MIVYLENILTGTKTVVLDHTSHENLVVQTENGSYRISGSDDGFTVSKFAAFFGKPNRLLIMPVIGNVIEIK